MQVQIVIMQDMGRMLEGGCLYGAMRCKRQDRKTSEEQAVGGTGWRGLKRKKKFVKFVRKEQNLQFLLKAQKRK